MLNYLINDINLKFLNKMLFEALEISIEINDNDFYNETIEIVKKFIILIRNKKLDEYVDNYYHYFFILIHEKNIDKFGDFINLIKLIIETNKNISNRWANFLEILFAKLKEDNLYKEQVMEIEYHLLIQYIKNDMSSFIFINYANFTTVNCTNKEIDLIIKNLNSLLQLSISKNNSQVFYSLLDVLNKILVSFEKNDKDLQQKFYNIYLSVIYKVDDKKILRDMTFDMLKQCVFDLDKKDSISSGFGELLIKNLAILSNEFQNPNEDTIIQIINFLKNLMKKEEEADFVFRHADKKKLLYSAIHNIGVSCIENNCEKALRKVSNALGWLTLYSIDRPDTTDLTNGLIDKAINLYTISKRMQISEKTMAFLCTLFTTLGTYCCKNVGYYRFREKIIRFLADEEIHKVETAIQLRTCDSDIWETVFENKSNEYTNIFLQKVKEAKGMN